MKFDRHNEREKDDQTRSLVQSRECRLSFIKYVMFDDDVRFRVSLGKALKRFRILFRRSRSFLKLLVQIN